MEKYLETTCVIIAWCALIGLLAAISSFISLHLRQGRLGYLRLFISQQPALIFGALLIFLAYHWWEWVLFFPVHLLSQRSEILLKALAPALVLLVASGFLRNLVLTMKVEYEHWSQQSFLLTAQSYGIRPWRWLAKVVILRSLIVSWGQSLPWLFGELIIVESIFNAPGLGLDIWFQAKQRDLTAMGTSVLILAVVYACCSALQHQLHSWLGRRLEGYI
ncbi:MAG: ABC transporter permease subunit [Oligoflexus sp.]